jgi:transposase-like protein
MVAVRWHLRYDLPYRDVEELLAERGIQVTNVTIYRWLQRFTPLLIDAAAPCRHVPGDRWFVDKTYVKVAGRWQYLYRSIDQYSQVIDVLVSQKRDLEATRRLFIGVLDECTHPTEVTTDRAHTYPQVIEELIPPWRADCFTRDTTYPIPKHCGLARPPSQRKTIRPRTHITKKNRATNHVRNLSHTALPRRDHRERHPPAVAVAPTSAASRPAAGTRAP